MKRKANSQKLELRANRNNDNDDGGAVAGDESPRSSGSLSSPSYSSSSSILSSTSSSDMSAESSCVSTEAEDTAGNPQNTAETALVGCPRCHMYVMLLEIDPKCPRCKSSVLLLDFLKEEEIKYFTKNKN